MTQWGSDDPKRIMWVDDEIELLRPHIMFLTERHYEVTPVSNGDDAIALCDQEHFDLVLLDEMMPGLDGLSTLERIKEIDANVPVIMITKNEEEHLMNEAIGRRIDDYLTKPYEPRELLLRINNILWRLPAEPNEAPTEARLGDVVFDIAREQLRRGPEHIPLTSTECRLLKLLAERPGAVFARDALLRIVAPGGGTRTVDVQVNRLRQKIEPDPKIPRYLQTVRGQGYILRTD